MTDEIFFIDAKNNVKISNECIDDFIKPDEIIIINDVPETKTRGNYKYEIGSKQHYKNTNYAMTYYNEHKKKVRCSNCNSPVLIFSMKRHMASNKCINNKI